MPKKKPNPLQFDISAAVVFRLGEELITDVVQALVELVKNSFDADATWVTVEIFTDEPNEEVGRRYADARGTILVEDNGYGMDEATIRRGWLTIANSPKREQKEAGWASKLGRTPIGDKGLGRLGSQRLAQNVEIVTRSAADPETEEYVAFSWGDFRGTSNLRDVPVEHQRRTVRKKKPGTKLILSDLREPEAWQAKDQLQVLQRKLSAMISPFKEAHDFRVHINVDGKPLELAEIARRIRETAQLRYAFDFDGERLRVRGSARLRYFRPNSRVDQKLFESLCRRDGGKELYAFLASRKRKGRPLTFARADRSGWFVEFGTDRALDDLAGVRREAGVVANPGPFYGEVDAVSLDSSDVKGMELGRLSEYRRLVKDLAGIRVYRDGFGIRVGEDWLGLGKQWTGGGSYYGLRPGNVLGFVAISARHNPDLVETTSREGFQETHHYENFYGLLSEFVRFAGDVQEFLRRGVLDYLNEYRDRSAGVEPGDEQSRIIQRIGDIASRLSSQKVKVDQHPSSLHRATVGAAKTLGEVRSRLDKVARDARLSQTVQNLEEKLVNISKAAAKEDEIRKEVTAVLDEASELKETGEVLNRRWEILNEHVTALYESVSLGLTAEILSHEINNIADRLAKQSSALLREVRRGMRKASIVTYVEEVRSSVTAMRKQLTHLTPSLRYLRERREQIDVQAFLQDLAEFYDERLARNKIRLTVRPRSPNFIVSMNRGKLTQIFDNLVLNAEYWLKEALRARTIDTGEIIIEADAPRVRVSDNGKGIEESIEDLLFEPFVTMKRKGEGRGLGLFVCRELLDSESCQIDLLPNRNNRNRRYLFELDLSGAVYG